MGLSSSNILLLLIFIPAYMISSSYASAMLTPQDIFKSRILEIPNGYYLPPLTTSTTINPAISTIETSTTTTIKSIITDSTSTSNSNSTPTSSKPISVRTRTTAKPQVLLGESCESDSNCKPELSECHPEHQVCTCKAYSVETNITTCLPGILLGFRCETDQQCAVKVPRSGCVNGVCACGDGYVAYRRHTCLAPAKQSEVCFENEQCALADRGSYCKFVVPRVFGRCQCQAGKILNGENRCTSFNTKVGQKCEEESDCSMPNAFCQRKLDGNSYCTCDIAFAPSSDMRRCLPTYRGLLNRVSLGYPCYAHLQCQLADPNSICNAGNCDCASSLKLKSESTCNAKMTGCHKHTFQCHSDGKCISWYFVCDGRADCADSSDEICDSEGECPRQAFQCGQSARSRRKRLTGKSNSSVSDTTLIFDPRQPMEKTICISRSKLCDGVENCEDGSDEEGCKVGKGKCPKGTFQCVTTKECLPEHQFCNAIADCMDWSDENELKCRTEFQPSDYCPFRCKNGLCRSSAILCSGIDGCGDNSDEEKCSVCRCPRVSGLSTPRIE